MSPMAGKRMRSGKHSKLTSGSSGKRRRRKAESPGGCGHGSKSSYIPPSPSTSPASSACGVSSDNVQHNSNSSDVGGNTGKSTGASSTGSTQTRVAYTADSSSSSSMERRVPSTILKASNMTQRIPPTPNNPSRLCRRHAAAARAPAAENSAKANQGTTPPLIPGEKTNPPFQLRHLPCASCVQEAQLAVMKSPLFAGLLKNYTSELRDSSSSAQCYELDEEHDEDRREGKLESSCSSDSESEQPSEKEYNSTSDDIDDDELSGDEPSSDEGEEPCSRKSKDLDFIRSKTCAHIRTGGAKSQAKCAKCNKYRYDDYSMKDLLSLPTEEKMALFTTCVIDHWELHLADELEEGVTTKQFTRGTLEEGYQKLGTAIFISYLKCSAMNADFSTFKDFVKGTLFPMLAAALKTPDVNKNRETAAALSATLDATLQALEGKELKLRDGSDKSGSAIENVELILGEHPPEASIDSATCKIQARPKDLCRLRRLLRESGLLDDDPEYKGNEGSGDGPSNRSSSDMSAACLRCNCSIASNIDDELSDQEVNDEGYTPPMEAAKEGHVDVVKSLLKHGAKINAKTEETHETALNLAACGNVLDVVDRLCNAEAHIELGASTPLMEASQEGYYRVVKYLLDRGADITRQTQTGDTALSCACENGHVDVAELLIQKGADPEHLSEGGQTPLMKACRGGHLDVIKCLLAKGVDVNRLTASNGHTPLSLACAGGHISAVEVLLAAGANPLHRLKDGSTMVFEAAKGGHTNVMRALLKYISREKQQSHNTAATKHPQLTAAPVSNTATKTHGQVVDVSKSGAGQSSQNKSVLRKDCSTSILKSSIAAPQQVSPSNNGTPEVKVKQQQQLAGTQATSEPQNKKDLQKSTIALAISLVEILLNKGVRVDGKNEQGCTPLWLACHAGHLEIAQILFRHRADLNSQDNRKISCLMAAFRQGQVKVIQWIVKNVQQFPSDQEMTRYMLAVQNEPDLLKRCQECAGYITQARDKLALEANRNATLLLQELELEKSREESKRSAAQRRREKKKKKKEDKKRQLFGTQDDDDDDDEDIGLEAIDSGIDANSQGSSSCATQADIKRRGGAHQQLLNTNGKSNKENHKHIPPQKSASISKSVSSAATTPPISDADIVTTLAEESQSSWKTSRKKTNKSNKTVSSAFNENRSVVADKENNNAVVQSPNVKNLNHDLKDTKENQATTSSSNNKSSSSVSSKVSSKFEKDNNVLKEKVSEQVEVDTGSSSINKNKKESLAVKEKVLGVKTSVESHISPSSYQVGANKGPNIYASSQGIMSGASVNKKSKGGLETNPASEPLMGISLSSSQLKQSSGRGGFPDHDRIDAHAVFMFPSASSSASSTATKSNSSNSISSAQTPSNPPSGGGPPNTKVGGTGTGRKDDGWKEVTRNCPSWRLKNLIVSSSVISRVIGCRGCNINAIRKATGAHIEVEWQQKGQFQPKRTIQIKGSAEAIKQAHKLITVLINGSDIDLKKLIPIRSSSGTSVASTPSSVVATTAPIPTIGSATSLLQQQNTAANITGNTYTVPPTFPGQQQQPLSVGLGSTAAGHSSNWSTPVDIVIPSSIKTAPFSTSAKSGVKGSPTQWTVLGGGSPPLGNIKAISPPIKKSVVVSSQQNQTNINKGGMLVSGNDQSGSGGTFPAPAELVQQTLQTQRPSEDFQTWEDWQKQHQQLQMIIDEIRKGPYLGHRPMEEMDCRGIMDLQPQTYEGQRLTNGGNVHPLLHMQNAPDQQPMFPPYGLEHDMEQHSLPRGRLPHAREFDDEQGGWGASYYAAKKY